MKFIELSIIEETSASLVVSLKCMSGLYYQALSTKIKEAIRAKSYQLDPIERSFILTTTKEHLFQSLLIISEFFTELQAHEKSFQISLSRQEVDTLKSNLKPFIANLEERLRLGMDLKDDIKVYCPDENIEKLGLIPTITKLLRGDRSDPFFQLSGKFYFLDFERKTLRFASPDPQFPQEIEVPLQIEEVNASVTFLAAASYLGVIENKIHKIIGEFRDGLPKNEVKRVVKVE